MSQKSATQASRSAEALPRNVKLLGWASFLNDVASEMIFPLLPQFLLTALGGNRFFLGIVEGAADSVASVVKLWSGAWSDRIRSRKPLVVVGYGVAAVVRPLIGLITLPWQLLAVRVADRVGKGVRNSPRDALIADSTDPPLRGRAFGFNRGMDHLGAAVGPVLAACFLWFRPDSLRTLFLLTLLPGLAVVVLLLFGLNERKGVGSLCLQQRSPNSGDLARQQRLPTPLIRYLLALGVFTLGNSSDAFLLVRAGELGVDIAMLPLLWCAFHVVKSAGNMLAGRAVHRLGPRPMILAGWLLYAAVYLLFGLATTAWQMWALFLAYGLFYAVSEPAERTLVANLAGSQQRGLAFGWFNFAIGIATLPASLIFGWLYEQYNALVAFGWGAGLALAAAAILLTGGGRRR